MNIRANLLVTITYCSLAFLQIVDAQEMAIQELELLDKSNAAMAANDSETKENDSDTPDRPSLIPPGLTDYMGRRIARTMHYRGAEWLIRDRREREERCSLMLANLGVRAGMTICDMGCGNGFHTLQLAKMTGESGHVLGVDVQPEMLGLLRERIEEQGIENVIPILGSYHNPHLPPKSIDMILLVDVYHEFSHPEQMLAAMRRSLKPNGVVVLLEYRQEDPKVPIKPLHKMSKKQVDRELTANGFELIRRYDELPWQHMLFYGAAPDWQSPQDQPSTTAAPPDSKGNLPVSPDAETPDTS